jgi:hypothetical protein
MSVISWKAVLAAVAAFSILASAAFATPGMPNAFYGSVLVNGQPAGDGATVAAKVDGAVVGTTTTSGGRYGYDPAFYVNDSNNDICTPKCPTVSFFVNDIDTGVTSVFCNGCVTQLDLSVTQQTPVTTTLPAGGGGGSGGGGGGGGGGAGGPPVVTCTLNGICDSWETHDACPSDCPLASTTTTTVAAGTNPAQACRELWACGEWGQCADRVQRRTCVDGNNCGTDNSKPSESQPCTAEENTAAANPLSSFLTGMAVALGIGSAAASGVLGLAVLAIVLLALFVFLKKRKQKPKKGKPGKGRPKRR